MNKIIYFSALMFLISCSSAPSKRTVKQEFISPQSLTKETAEKIAGNLTLGANQMSAGYSTEVTLITEPLINAEQTEKGKSNMESSEKVKLEIEKEKAAFVKNQTCFRFKIHTYSLPQAQFKNWVAKAKDSSEKVQDIVFSNVGGVQSVPSPGSDMNGRNWHNGSIGCTSAKIDTTKSFSVFLIPQLKNNKDQDESTNLTWEIL